MNGCSAPSSSLHWPRHMVPTVPAQLWQRAEAAPQSPHTHLLSSPSPVGSLWNGVSLKSSGDRYWLFSAEPSTHTQPCPAGQPVERAQLSPTRAGLDKLLEHKLLIFIKPRVFVRLPYNNVCSIFQESFKKGLQGWVSYLYCQCSMLKDIVCNIIWYCQLEATLGVIKNETLVFVNFSAQDASILKISVAIIKRRSWGTPPTCKVWMILSQFMALPKKHCFEIIKDLLVF